MILVSVVTLLPQSGMEAVPIQILKQVSYLIGIFMYNQQNLQVIIAETCCTSECRYTLIQAGKIAE
jgi:hypothetical protein